jgi:hypothetical protein
MQNHRLDFVLPLVSPQESMLRLLETLLHHKRRFVQKSGQDISQNEMIKKSLAWLDRYLRPAK